MRDLTDEINALALDNADSYDLIVINSLIHWFSGQLDSVHETGVYAVSLTYSAGHDANGAVCPCVSFGFNTVSHLGQTGADRYDAADFLVTSQDVMDSDGAIDIWLGFKGYDMIKDTQSVVRMLGAAVKKLHDSGIINEIFFRELPVIIAADVSQELLDEVNSMANGSLITPD